MYGGGSVRDKKDGGGHGGCIDNDSISRLEFE